MYPVSRVLCTIYQCAEAPRPPQCDFHSEAEATVTELVESP